MTYAVVPPPPPGTSRREDVPRRRVGLLLVAAVLPAVLILALSGVGGVLLTRRAIDVAGAFTSPPGSGPGGTSDPRAAPIQPVEPPSDLPVGTYRDAACPFPTDGAEARTEIVCGWLAVPERHDDEASPAIHLAVATLRRQDRPAAPDPVLYLEGGPGGSALVSAVEWTWDPLLDQRDIVLLDQRGTGWSVPSLRCDELADQAPLDALSDCRRRLDGDGVDVTAYGTAAIAADVAMLRTALGYEEWNLWGSSYGTRVALAVLRDHPAGIRSAVLESPYPMQVDAYAETVRNAADALDELFSACDADEACRAAHPDLRGTFHDLVEELDRRPLKIPAEPGAPPGTRTWHYDGAGLADEVLVGLADSWANPALPDWIGALAAGEKITFYDFVEMRYAEPQDEPAEGVVDHAWYDEREAFASSDGAFFTIECAEEIDHSSIPNDGTTDIAAEVEDRAGDDVPSAVTTSAVDLVVGTYEACDRWDVPPAPAIEDRPVSSDVPVLVMTGSFDPITPPRWGAEAAATLSHAHVFVFPGLGHAVVDADPCPQSMVAAFYRDPVSTPPDGCLRDFGPPFLDVAEAP